ncbi:TPR-like protein [Hesseltinella vesiculosa]|uniref:TPR-like protein n=1 Tax=Hesseltinella vesiculosa TaxID=101127 RepID=A0A1X2GNN1_9FUNG|nr:TPR-like protein [Hesseltinella vesiculosa]
MSSEQQAKDLIAQAQKKLNSWSFFGPSNKFEDAAEIYERAANMFKMAQQWRQAGDAYTEAAQLYEKCGSSALYDGAKALENAAKAYKRQDPNRAAQSLTRAIQLSQSCGQLRMAAKQVEELAAMYEGELDNPKAAFEAYNQAAELFMADDSRAMANKCLLKVGQIAAELEMYDVAIEKFEQVAAVSVDDSLTKWSVKEYLFKAGLCHLATDDIAKTEQALKNYCTLDLSFDSTREYALLKGVFEAYEAGDLGQFQTLVYDFDKLSRLDSWKTAILLKIKNALDTRDLR